MNHLQGNLYERLTDRAKSKRLTCYGKGKGMWG